MIAVVSCLRQLQPAGHLPERFSLTLVFWSPFSQCDGQNPCGRCSAQKDVECVYEVPVRQSKENLRSEIEQLRRQQRSSESVLAALARPDIWEEVLKRLRAGENVDVISNWLNSLPAAAVGIGIPPYARSTVGSLPNPTALMAFAGASASGFTQMAPRLDSPGSGQPSAPRPPPEGDPNSPWHFSGHSQTDTTRSNSHPDAMSWSRDHRPQSRVGSWVEHVTIPDGQQQDSMRYRGLDQILAPSTPEMKVPAETWTNITGDSALVQHLLALYFCWEYPTFASLSKEHFLKDFKVGRQRYCSSLLVNALLALGCRFSSQPSTRSNPHDARTSGDHFFKECQKLLSQEDSHHTLTTIQALGIMSIREASCGRDSESWYYAGQSIRLAIEMGLHTIGGDRADEDETAVKAATFWGAFALDQ